MIYTISPYRNGYMVTTFNTTAGFTTIHKAWKAIVRDVSSHQRTWFVIRYA